MLSKLLSKYGKIILSTLTILWVTFMAYLVIWVDMYASLIALGITLAVALIVIIIGAVVLYDQDENKP